MGQLTRVAISADSGDGLDSVVSPHFGRCPYYVLVDLDGPEVQRVSAVGNPYYSQHVPGVVPEFIRSQGAHVMLTGGMGRRAIGLFQEYGIKAVTGASGTVRHALQQHLGGSLEGAAPCHESSAHACDHEAEPSGADHGRGEEGRLREETEMLQQQLAEVLERLDRLTTS